MIPDGREANRVAHFVRDILRAGNFAIACGYEDADDLDRLCFDPAFKLACGRLPGARSRPSRAGRMHRPFATWSA